MRAAGRRYPWGSLGRSASWRSGFEGRACMRRRSLVASSSRWMSLPTAGRHVSGSVARAGLPAARPASGKRSARHCCSGHPASPVRGRRRAARPADGCIRCRDWFGVLSHMAMATREDALPGLLSTGQLRRFAGDAARGQHSVADLDVARRSMAPDPPPRDRGPQSGARGAAAPSMADRRRRCRPARQPLCRGRIQAAQGPLAPLHRLVGRGLVQSVRGDLC